MLVALLRRNGLRKGVVGGDRRWLSVWIVVVGAQLIRRIAASNDVVERFELKEGETIVVTDLGRSDQP